MVRVSSVFSVGFLPTLMTPGGHIFRRRVMIPKTPRGIHTSNIFAKGNCSTIAREEMKVVRAKPKSQL